MSKRHSSDLYRRGSTSGSSSGSEDEEDERRKNNRRTDNRGTEDQRTDDKRPKLSFGIGKKPESSSDKLPAPKQKGIQIKLGGQKIEKPSLPTVKPPSRAVSAAFNVDDDDEVEEMPPEAKMRMRNIGRETPTSAGPNSFGKTKQGFCDAKKVFEKTMKKAMESGGDR